jgi:hypothetical protein
MAKAFISCVKENIGEAEYLVELLKKNGVDCWLFTRNLKIGQSWEREIQSAIVGGAYYIPLFSREWASRDRSYMNEELRQAMAEIRMRPDEAGWFLPVSLDGTPAPDWKIDADRSLRSFQAADLSKNWKAKVVELLEAVGVETPNLAFGEPLAAGYPDRMDIRRGQIRYDRNSLDNPDLMNAINTIDDGFIGRSKDNYIIAVFHVVSNTVEGYELGERLGLSQVVLVSDAATISTSQESPTRFLGEALATLRGGETVRSGGNEITLQQDITVHSLYEVEAWIVDGGIEGRFIITMRVDAMGDTPFGTVEGRFAVEFDIR